MPGMKRGARAEGAGAAAVAAAEIAAAVKALGIDVPVRAASRKGTQIILHTRSGDYAYTPPARPQDAST